MKIFIQKNILQKTIIAILMVICINFIAPTYSNAAITGGVLLRPFTDFACMIGDAIINGVQRLMTGEWGAEYNDFSLNGFLLKSSEYYSNSNRYKSGVYKYTIGDSKNSDEVPVIKVNPDKQFTKVDGEYYIPIATYSPEQIFSGNVPGLDINFISPNFDDGSAADLQSTISKWYVALRNLATVGLLCVLVYVGIRIMLSSTAGDKAKYKRMFTDWLIALCILFFLHYIMSFVLTLTEAVCTAIGGDGSATVNIYDESAGKTFSTNLLGLTRFKAQSDEWGQKLLYMLFYLVLIVYTLMFTWNYLRRLLMMAFLTIIAPLIALTYPIDKIGDSKAQAFNMWLREYVYNALIQPFHLIIYTVFVGSAIDLVADNMLYALACMGFLLFAEKFLKKLFGFDSAPLGTMGALAGFTAGSIASKIGKGGSSSNNKIEKGKQDFSEEKTPRYKRTHGTDGIDYKQNPNLGMGQEENNADLNTREKAELEQHNLSNNTNNLSNNRNNLSDEENEEYNRLKDELDNIDYNDMYMNEDKYAEKQTRFAELEKQKLGQDEDKIDEQPIKVQSIKNPGRFKQGVNNIISEHGGGKRVAKKMAIGGVKALGAGTKFVGKTGFKFAGAAFGAAMGLASGKGIGGVVAGASAGKAIGDRLGNAVTSIPGKVGNAGRGAVRVGKGVAETFRREIDTFNGDHTLQDKAQAKAFMKDAATEQYIRDKFMQEKGYALSDSQVKDEMRSIQAYADEGMTDIAQIYRAKKAEKFGVSAQQSAKIALLAQDRGIDSKVLGDEKQLSQRRADFTQEFIDKGLSEQQAAQKADYVLNVMKAQVGQRHNLGQAGSATPVTNGVNTGTNGTQTRKPRQRQNNNGQQNTSTQSGNRGQNSRSQSGNGGQNTRRQNGNSGNNSRRRNNT